MKLKTTINTTYIVVMLTPIIIAAALYYFINNFHSKNNLTDKVLVSELINKYSEKLNKKELYTKKYLDDLNLIDQDDKDKVHIVLYNSNGTCIFASDKKYSGIILTKEDLFKDLNAPNYTATYTSIRKPVFDKESRFMGVYEVIILRDNVIEAVSSNSKKAIIIFIILNLIIFIAVAKIMDRKLTKPVKLLISAMGNFSKNNTTVTVPYKGNDEIGTIISEFHHLEEEIIKREGIIEENQRNKNYMISAISHDLKTPITAIRAYGETLEDNEANSEAKAVILNKCDFLNELINDLLTYSILTSEYIPSKVIVEGEEFFDTAFSGYEKICDEKDINLKIYIDLNLEVNLDVKYIMRAIDNIMSNAIRHTKVKGDIFLFATTSNNQLPKELPKEALQHIYSKNRESLIFGVLNTGDVISKETIDLIFKPFYQGDEARRKWGNRGAGLGLNITKMIIEKHDGNIRAFSAEDVGTLMLCEVPIIN